MSLIVICNKLQFDVGLMLPYYRPFWLFCRNLYATVTFGVLWISQALYAVHPFLCQLENILHIAVLAGASKKALDWHQRQDISVQNAGDFKSGKNLAKETHIVFHCKPLSLPSLPVLLGCVCQIRNGAGTLFTGAEVFLRSSSAIWGWLFSPWMEKYSCSSIPFLLRRS